MVTERLTPDFTIRGRMPTKLEYDTSLRVLRAFREDYKKAHCAYMGRDLSQLEHDVWCALHQCGILHQDGELWHRLTQYGEVYARQRLGTIISG